MNRVIILDPSCFGDLRSHHVNSVTGHAYAFSGAGLKVEICANIGCSITVKDATILPVFPYTIYDDYRKHYISRHIRILRYARQLLTGNNVHHRISKFIDENHLDRSDHFFIPTLDWILFQAMTRIYSARTNVPSLHMLLMYEKADWMTGGYPYMKILQGIRKLQNRGNNVFVYTETREHALHLKEILGFVPPNYPFPALPVTGAQPLPVAKDKIYVSVLGGGRRDKGYNLLPEIISTFNTSYTGNIEVVFIIQLARKEDYLEKETDLLKQIKNVVLLDNRLSRTVYEDNLLRCHIALFPYSRVYAARGSGAVNEAIANGIPIICSRHTALAEAITTGNGLTATTTAEFADSITNIIGQLDIFQARAKTAMKLYLDNLLDNPVIRKINSSSVKYG